MGQGRLTLGPEFAAFERLWRRDELDHAIGFAKVYAVLYGEDERSVLDRLRSREADFSGLEAFLGDELSVCLVLAYDELATTRSYAADWHDFYPRFGDERLTRWIQRVAADEARHYGNLVRVLRTAHAHELGRAPGLLDAICRRDLEAHPYRGTFVLDHDDAAVFPADRLRECARRVSRDLSPKPP